MTSDLARNSFELAIRMHQDAPGTTRPRLEDFEHLTDEKPAPLDATAALVKPAPPDPAVKQSSVYQRMVDDAELMAGRHFDRGST